MYKDPYQTTDIIESRRILFRGSSNLDGKIFRKTHGDFPVSKATCSFTFLTSGTVDIF